MKKTSIFNKFMNQPKLLGVNEKSPNNSTELDIPYEDKRVINFKIISAVGGHIIETTKYVDSDSSKYINDQRRIHNLYIVSQNEDLVETLNNIFTLESLR